MRKRETELIKIKFQLEKAKSNGVKYTFLADAQNLEIPKHTPEIQGGFDAAFSNATLHWCKRDPLGVLNSVRKVLKPGGRFVVEMGGFMNCIGRVLWSEKQKPQTVFDGPYHRCKVCFARHSEIKEPRS
jgi:SAM-dependent methyltransferase